MFSVRMDEGQNLTMRITSTNTRQLLTVGRLSRLGRYLRCRQGIEWNELVTKELLHEYGGSEVTLRRQEGKYYLDFGRPDSK